MALRKFKKRQSTRITYDQRMDCALRQARPTAKYIWYAHPYAAPIAEAWDDSDFVEEAQPDYSLLFGAIRSPDRKDHQVVGTRKWRRMLYDQPCSECAAGGWPSCTVLYKDAVTSGRIARQFSSDKVRTAITSWLSALGRAVRSPWNSTDTAAQRAEWQELLQSLIDQEDFEAAADDVKALV